MRHLILSAKAGCLLLHVLDQLGTLNAIREPGKVLDQRRNAELPTRLVTFDHQGLEIRASSIDRGGQPGASGAEDDHIAYGIVHKPQRLDSAVPQEDSDLGFRNRYCTRRSS